MYEVTQDYLDKATAAGRVYSLRVDVGEVVNGAYVDKAQYLGGVGVLSLKIVRGQTTGGFSLGGTVCAQLSATFTNDVDVRVKDRLQVYVRFGSGDGATAWHGLGWFYVDSVKQGLYSKSVTAYDAMLRFEKNYKSKLTYPAKTSDVLNEISDQIGINLSSSLSLINDATIETTPQMGESKDGKQRYYTRRAILGYIAATNAGEAYIDVDFKINLAIPTETGYTIEAVSVISQTIDDTDFMIDGIVWNKSGVSYSLNDEFTENTIELVNPLSYGGEELILHNLETKLVGLAYSSVTLKKQGTGIFQLGDLVNYVASDGTTYTMLVMGIAYDFSNGFFSETLYSLAKSASQQEYAGSQVVSTSEFASSQINVGSLTQYEVLSDTEIIYNGTTYTFTAGESGEITEVTTDKGGYFAPVIPATLADISMHNAAFMALALLSKLKSEPITDIPNAFIRFNTDSYTESGTAIIAENRLGTGTFEFRQGTISDNAFCVTPSNESTMGYGAFTLDSALQEYTVYVVLKRSLNSCRTYFICDSNYNTPVLTIYGQDGQGQRTNGWVTGTGAQIDLRGEAKTVYAIACNSATTKFYVNGTLAHEFSKCTVLPKTVILTLGRYIGYFDRCPIWLYDNAFCDTCHNESTVEQVSAMLMGKYGITGG